MSRFGRNKREPAAGDPQEATFAQGELAAALRPFVMPPDRLPPAAAAGAPAALPGLVMATAVRMGDQVNFVPVTSMDGLGGTQTVWSTAMRNVATLDGVRMLREDVDENRPDTGLITLWSDDDPFVAGRVTVLDWLIEQLHEGPNRYGALVAVPTMNRLVLHVVTGPGVLTVAENMALATAHLFETAGESGGITPEVFFVSADRRAERIAYPAGSGLAINTKGLLGEVLFGPPPRGLGLEH
jgi:hypothetical protein